MPSLNKSGNIFNLEAGAGFDEGILGGNAKTGLSLDYNFYVDTCHGIDAAIGAELLAQAEANLKLLWLFKGIAQGNASGAIGAKLNVKADLNAFNVLGITAEVYAAIEAKAAGSLSLNLTFEDISAAAKNAIKDDYLYDIFIAFLNELTIGAGVMGNVNAGAAASAYFLMRGTLIDDEKAGFEIGFDYNVALKVGGGYGMYAKLGIDNPKRFFLYATERTVNEISDKIRESVAKEYHPLIEILQFVVPVVLNSSYELAQQKLEMGFGFNAADATKAVTNNFFSQLQRFLLDKLTEAGLNLISDELNRLIEQVLLYNLPQAIHTEIKLAAEVLLEKIKKEGITSDNLNEIVDLVTQLFGKLNTITEQQRTAITVVWLAYNTAEALRGSKINATSFASGSSGFFKMGQLASEVSIRLNNAPQLVKEEISFRLRLPISGLNDGFDTSTAIDFILTTSISKELISKVPHAETLFRLIDIHLGLTPGELFESAFKTDWQESSVQSELYVKVRNLVKDMLDGYVQTILITELRKEADNNQALLTYIDDVLSPSSKIFTEFVFTRLDHFLEQNGTITLESLFDDSFYAALSTMVSKIFITNVLTVTNIFFDYTLQNTHTALRTLADAFKSDPDHIMSVSSLQLFQSLLKPAGLEGIKNNEVLIASRELAANLCYAAADVSGPLVFSAERINKLKSLFKKIYAALDPMAESTPVLSWDALFTKVTECTYYPNPKATSELILLQSELLLSGFEVMAPQLLRAIELFYLRLTLATVQEIEKKIEAIFDSINLYLDSMKKGLEKVYDELEKIEKAYQSALIETAIQLELLKAKLKGDTTEKRYVIEDVQRFGLSRIDSTDTATITSYNALFTPGSPTIILLEIAIDLVADVLATTIQGLENASDFPTLIHQIINEVITKIQTTLHLPTELPIDDIEKAMIAYFDRSEADMQKLIEQKETEIEASRLKNDKLAEEQIRKEVLASAEKKNALPKLKKIDIEIVSPVSFLDKKSKKLLEWTYGRELPVQIKVKGANTSYLCLEPQSIFLAINGRPYSFEFGQWTANEKGTSLIFNAVFDTRKHPLVQGINTIECTVIKPDKTTIRQGIEFIMNPELASDCTVVFDWEKSMLDTGGDDHIYRHNESVAFTNSGNMPADMSGWWLSDRKNHVFEFPELILMPHQTVRVYTGYGNNDTLNLYQNKKRAVWNNTEDTVLLINKDKVLVLNQIYRL